MQLLADVLLCNDGLKLIE